MKIKLPMLASDSLVVGCSDNSKLGQGQCGATYRPVGAGDSGTCPSTCMFLPVSLGGMSPVALAARIVSGAAGSPAALRAAAAVWAAEIGASKFGRCYAASGRVKFSALRSMGSTADLRAIPSSLDARLHISGDFVRRGRSYDSRRPSASIDWEYVEVVCNWARGRSGAVWVYTHIPSRRLLDTLKAAGVAVWLSCDSWGSAARWLRAGYRVTVAGSLPYLREFRQALQGIGFRASWCPWDLSIAHGNTVKQLTGVVSCSDCRMCIDGAGVGASAGLPDCVLFVVH